MAERGHRGPAVQPSSGDTDDPMTTRRHPTILANPVVLAVAFVGFGAAVALVGAGSVGPDRRGGSPAGDTAVTAVAVVVGAAALAFAAFVGWRTRSGRRPRAVDDEPKGAISASVLRPLLVRLLATILLLLAYGLVFGPCIKDKSSAPSARRHKHPVTTVASDTGAERRPTDRPDWTVVAGVVLGVAGLGLAFLTARNRRPSSDQPDEADLSDEIALGLADLDGLEGDADHRRVVIRTYARMERALGRTGIPRAVSETAQEFLLRALSILGASVEPARSLTGLFEQARFSTHPVDASMRADAAAALRSVRDELDARARLSEPEDVGLR